MIVARRSFLKGLGVSVALPWLESVTSFATDTIKPPVRTLVTFTGMGFHSSHWWSKGNGKDMTLGPCLTPLEPWKNKMIFIKGLWHEKANNGVIHCMQTGNILSGSEMEKKEVRTGISFDQVMAKNTEEHTRIPSLVLGCEDPMPGLQDGHPLLYGSHISWSSPVSPTWTETRPSLAFDSLFKESDFRNDNRVVDSILDDAKSLQKKLSSSDKHRFDEYLVSIHEIENRIERAKTKKKIDIPIGYNRPADGIPKSLPEYWKLMNDIIVLAFRTDTTRIATLKYCNDASSIVYSHLNIKDHHHYLAHTQPESLVTLNQFFMSQLAYLCAQMSEINEGENSLLDNVTMMHCSSMLHGNHDSKQLPVILLGGAGGNLRGGRTLDYLDSSNRKMCSLFLSIMDWGGLHTDKFGDSHERLANI